MKFIEKQVELNDGTACVLRSPNENDAEKMIEYLIMTSEETHYLVRYPEEIKITVEEEKEILKGILDSSNSIMIGAFIGNDIAGNAGLSCLKNHIKLKHRAVFGISIKKKYWNKGIGNILIKEVIDQAKQMGYEQIELGVYSDNEKAIVLYKKYNFDVWGNSKNAFKLKDGTYCDELLMGRMI